MIGMLMQLHVGAKRRLASVRTAHIQAILAGAYRYATQEKAVERLRELEKPILPRGTMFRVWRKNPR